MLDVLYSEVMPAMTCMLFPLIFVLIIVFVALTIVIIDIAMNHGKETVEYRVPYKSPETLMWEIHQFFLRQDYQCMFYQNQIKAEKGNEFLMGVRTFIFTIEYYGGGSILKGEFYLKGLMPRYMKLSQYGYLAILPRRMGRKRKEDLLMTLGLTEMDRIS